MLDTIALRDLLDPYNEDSNAIRAYICGPMAGLSRFNFPAFEEACDRLRADGFQVTSPHEMNLGAETAAELREALENDIAAVKNAEIVFLLPGSDRSPGAMVEILVAEAFGVPCLDYADWAA